jgi:hypothetical protein
MVMYLDFRLREVLRVVSAWVRVRAPFLLLPAASTPAQQLLVPNPVRRINGGFDPREPLDANGEYLGDSVLERNAVDFIT